MPRHNKRGVIANDSEYYEPLRKNRDLNRVRHYTTPRMRNPTVRQRAKMQTDRHIWKYGDRLYSLADKYYADPQFWWVIAWWNGYGVEADIKIGAVISIPLNITQAIRVLGV
jgi:hypothetical protein